MPGIINDRLFSVLDKNRNDYIDVIEFIEGMIIIFCENFEKLYKFIFDFYDFDKDGKISKEDIKVVLSYIPLNINKYSSKKLRYEKEEFKDRVESQDELHILLQKCFIYGEYLNESNFLDVIENVSSDIFLFILIFLFDKKPFSNNSIKEFEGKKLKTSLIKINRTPILTSKYIASPNLQSKFSPSIAIRKSPMMTKRLKLENNSSMNQVQESKNRLMKFAGKDNNINTSKNVLMKYSQFSNKDNNREREVVDTDENVYIKNIPVNRKKRNDLKNLEGSKLNEFKKLESISDLNKGLIEIGKLE